MMRTLRTLAVGVLLASIGAVFPLAQPASAASCAGTYTIVVGGAGDNNSMVFHGNVSQRVGYPAEPTGWGARQGTNELNRLVRNQRAQCPGQHVKMMGYSLGAAVVHTWVTENWTTFGNVNAVLIADPKRQGGPRGNGVSGEWFTYFVGAPLSGVDRFFGNIPVVSICTNDYVCDTQAPSGVPGYIWGGNHGAYSFNVDDYSNTGHGQWFDGVFMPW